MDVNALASVLEGTLDGSDPSHRETSEKQLGEVYTVPEFSPCLMQIVLDGGRPMQIRLSGVIYLKNMIMKYWKEKDVVDGATPSYVIPQEAKVIIRENIIEAIIQTPVQICRQLCASLEYIIKEDYPGKWNRLVEKIHKYITSDSKEQLLGGLLTLHKIAQRYKFKKVDKERLEYTQPMETLMPIMLERMKGLLQVDTEDSLRLQHRILKVFMCSIQYYLPFNLLTDVTTPQWMAVFQNILQQPVPAAAMEGKTDDAEKSSTGWWKCKKWATRILWRLFEHYGNPNMLTENQTEYIQFAKYYENNFAVPVAQCMLHQLNQKRQGHFISSRVLQLTLNYVEQCIHHTPSWNVIKPHFQVLFQDILFPLLCHSEEDEHLWQDDPHEYIRGKYDVFEDLISPVTAAVTVIHQSAKHRKGILDIMVAYCMAVINVPPDQVNPQMKDGSLHVIGVLANILMKRKTYKHQIEKMITTYVIPEFTSSLGYLRARACWMLHHFCDAKFSDESNAQILTNHVLRSLTTDTELPVKVDAAIALQFLVKFQPIAQRLIKPHVKPIIQELLKMIRESENDDLTGVLEFLIKVYSSDIGDVAVELCAHLAEVFGSICESATTEEDDGYRALTAMGLLNTIQTLVKAAVDNQVLLDQMEATLVQLIVAIFQKGYMDFYEEMLALLDFFTANRVSPSMWQFFYLLYQIFQTEGGYDVFCEMTPIYFNFITVDTTTFLSNPKHIEIVIGMCRQMLTTEPGESVECYACKLLEVLIIHCHQSLDQFFPAILQVVLDRLTKPQKCPEVRIICEVVVMAALFCQTPITLDILQQVHFPNSPEPITEQFFSKLLKEDFVQLTGIHDRKISVLALCSLLTCQVRLPCIVKLAALILPAVSKLLEALQQAYLEAEEASADEMTSDEEEEDSEEDELEEEKGDIDLQKLKEKAVDALSKLSDPDINPYADLMLEVDFETWIDDDDCGIDEYIVFNETIAKIAQVDHEWYAALTNGLTPEDTKRVEAMLFVAKQKKEYEESKHISESGGYQFDIVQVPQTFSFGNGAPSNFHQ